MSIFSRFALRSLAKSRTHTIVSIIGIALSCALLCAVLTSVVSMTRMLYERTAADEGSWEVEAAGLTQEGLASLDSDSRVAQHLEVAELGAVQMGAENAPDYGAWLFAKTWPINPAGTTILNTPEIESGRAPEAPGEIVLPHFMRDAQLAPCGLTSTDGGPIEIGSTVELQLGTRTVHNLDGDADPPGTYTGTSMQGTYFNDGEAEEAYEQDLGTITGAVVGFYRAYGYSSSLSLQGNCAYVYPDDGAIERAISDGSDATIVYSSLTVRDPRDAEPLAAELAKSDQVTAGSTTHTSLLRWEGVTGSSDVWNALYQIAAILAVVIVVAGVSLVYNSFAISVAERTRMFGLLASLGASKRQLRRTVLTEALVLAAIGIPVGLLLGLAGCFVVFHFTGAGLASMFDVDTYGLTVRVVISPATLGLSALLALITVLVSAWIPALRASRVSAVDAIRQTQDVRLGRRTRRKLARAERRTRRTGMATSPNATGLAGTLFGIPGFIAHRNLSRSTSKGRVTVAALAVSVALLIIAGAIGNTLSYAGDTALDTLGSVDLSVTVDATASEGSDGTIVRSDGQIDHDAFQTALAGLYDDAQEIPDATPLGYYTSYIADAIVPASMVSPNSGQFFGSLLADGRWSGPVYVDFLDTESWHAYIAQLGLDEDAFCDPANPRAIALNDYDLNDAGTYSSYNPLTGPGDIETFSYADIEGMYGGGIVSDDSGEARAWFNAPDGSEEYLPLDEGTTDTDTITVGALADTAPEGLSTNSNTLHLILPATAISLTHNMGFGSGQINFSTGGSAEAATNAQDAFENLAANHPELDSSYDNAAQERTQARLMSTTIQTFIYCFTVICGLIAVANVFNTLTNSLILRRREFAVLKSVGMGNRAFRRMITYECASYALRGFLIGFTLACAVNVALGHAMRGAFTTYTAQIPWLQVGISAAVVLGVILLSVIYALRHCRTSSVVEALREEVM